MKTSLTLSTALFSLSTLPAMAHADGTAHVHSAEGLAWAIGISLIATFAYLAVRGRR